MIKIKGAAKTKGQVGKIFLQAGGVYFCRTGNWHNRYQTARIQKVAIVWNSKYPFPGSSGI